MLDRIKRQIEQRVSEGSPIRIERMSTATVDSRSDTSLIAAHVSSGLERHMSEMYDDVDRAEAAAQPRRSARQFAGLQTAHQLERHFEARIRADVDRPMAAFDFAMPSGTCLAPPYDREWADGNGIAFGGRVTGKAITIPTANGSSAAGIGFFLTTNQPALVAISPQGMYDFNWLALENLPFVRSRGGMGIAIYTDSAPQPMMSRQPVLWSIAGATALSGQVGSGRIASAASPASGFGPIPLAPALINMVPGSKYLVWVWCWQTSRLEAGDGFIAFLRFHMPCVIIDAGPPILLH